MPKAIAFDEPQTTSYCVEMWVRDEQIKLSSARIKGRIQAGPLRDEPIACVSYGPSLNDTWEQIKDFRYVMTCSGAHKFLVDRGITPTFHVEVDPRPHKVALIGQPCQGTEYLIASACHPAVFDHLEGYHVNLWHIFDQSAEALRMLPAGEWAITGGSSVGLRTLTLARFLGFTNLHVFGMDGCHGASGVHAAEHPNQPPDYAETVYEGVTYRTTNSQLFCAKQTWHELNQLTDVTATFYGEGLVQAMAKSYVRQPNTESNIVGFVKPELISASYAELNARLHKENIAYGVGGGKHAPIVKKLCESLKTTSVLDYGCGKGYLAKALDFPIWEYDPAIEGKSADPRPADLVICTDVLEHIEPDRLDFVLADLRRVVRKVGYFTVHTKAAMKFLADGRNAHLIQEGAGWWRDRLSRYFTVAQITPRGPELHVVVGPKRKVKAA
jgi:uncharacterized Rossmann fold enzyme